MNKNDSIMRLPTQPEINNNVDLTNYIIKLQTFCNNYNKYDIEYINLKFNISSYNEFKLLFKKKHKIKLIFNSSKSESLFINFRHS
jgi:hypothetical protein